MDVGILAVLQNGLVMRCVSP